MKFIGIDLGWHGKPTGVAVFEGPGPWLRLAATDRLEQGAILPWIDRHTGDADAMIAVDAPLVITNQTGSRPVDRAVSQCFWKEHAGCHSVNLGRLCAAQVRQVSDRRPCTHTASFMR